MPINKRQTSRGQLGSTSARASPSKARWELDWQGANDILKIAIFDERNSALQRNKGASTELRERVSNLEWMKPIAKSTNKKQRGRQRRNGKFNPNFDGIFKKIAKAIVLLFRCFNARRKNAIRPDQFTFDSGTNRQISAERSILNTKLSSVFTTPPNLRSSADLRSAASYLRASGVTQAVLGNLGDDEILARLIFYERYENGRVVAEQGKRLKRFYFVIRGKILLVNEYHVGNSVISKTTGILSKGDTTSVDEMQTETSRSQTLICSGTVETLVLDKEDFFNLRRDKRFGAKEYLASHPILKELPSQFIPQASLRLVYYPRGAVVCSVDKEHEWVYVIKSGGCSLVRSQLVNNVIPLKKSLFNKQTPHELGCERVRSRHRFLAEFRAWQKGVSTDLSKLPNPETVNAHKLDPKNLRTPLERPTNSAQIRSTDKEKLPLFSSLQDNRRSVNDMINPLDATMAGISRKPNPLLGAPRMIPPVTPEIQRGASKSAPTLVRRAFLELGKLKPGDVFGLDDLNGGAEQRTNQIALLSNGADVVMIKRRCFMQIAPANLLMKLSGRILNYPSTNRAKTIIEEKETWQLYKQNLLILLKKQNKPYNHKSISMMQRGNRNSAGETPKFPNTMQRLTRSAPINRVNFI